MVAEALAETTAPEALAETTSPEESAAETPSGKSVQAAADEPGKRPGITERMMARPAGATVVLVGAISFIPGVAYLAAVQSIGNVSAGWAPSALALLAVVFLDLWLVWLPVLLYLAAPDRTVARVKATNAWVRQHGQLLLAALLAVVGVALLASGLAGLLS
jgi:hypothetical protein